MTIYINIYISKDMRSLKEKYLNLVLQQNHTYSTILSIHVHYEACGRKVISSIFVQTINKLNKELENQCCSCNS